MPTNPKWHVCNFRPSALRGVCEISMRYDPYIGQKVDRGRAEARGGHHCCLSPQYCYYSTPFQRGRAAALWARHRLARITLICFAGMLRFEP